MKNETGGSGAAHKDSSSAPGLLASLKRMLAHGLELIQLRVELLQTEWEAEKLRLFGSLAMLLMAMLLVAAALGMLSLCLLLLTPEAWRWMSALGLGLFYAGAAWGFWRRASQQLSQKGGALAGSTAELSRDRSSLEA